MLTCEQNKVENEEFLYTWSLYNRMKGRVHLEAERFCILLSCLSGA